MSLTPDQLMQRRIGVSASEVAAIVGKHPDRSIIDVWREKRGDAPSFSGNSRTKWGTLLEPVIRADYEERTGLRVEIPGTLSHPVDEWMLCSPDGVGWRMSSPERGLEIKCHTVRLAHKYGEPGTDDIPVYVLTQAMWCLAVTGLRWWDVVAFIDNQPRDYVIERDEEAIGMLKERCHRFLVDNVRGGAIPEPDGSDSFDTWLTSRHKTNGDVLIDIDDDRELLAMIQRGRSMRSDAATLETELAKLGQALKLRIGDNAGLTWRGDDGKQLKLTWKRNKPSTVVDYVGIANDARTDARLMLSARGDEVRKALAGGLERAEMLLLIEGMNITLEEIAARTDAAYSSQIDGDRPMRWPYAWNATKKQEGKADGRL